MGQKAYGAALLVGLTTFLYQFRDITAKHSTWSEFTTPAGVGELAFLFAGALAAVIGALGLQKPEFLKSTAEKIEDGTKKIGVVLLALVLGGAVSGCALLKTSPKTTPTAEQSVKNQEEILQAVKVAERVGILLQGLQATEINLHRIGRLSDAEHEKIQLGFKAFAEGALAALDQADDVGVPYATRKEAIASALRLSDKLVADAIVPIKDAATRAEIRAVLSGIQALLAFVSF